jgi:hypothetical protein
MEPLDPLDHEKTEKEIVGKKMFMEVPYITFMSYTFK